MTIKHISNLVSGFKTSGRVEALIEAIKTIEESGECRGCDDQGKITLKWKNGSVSKSPCPNASADCNHGKRKSLRYAVDIKSEMLSSGIPKRHVDNLPGTANSTTRQVDFWKFKDFLTISGNPGCGKSFAIASAIYKRCLNLQLQGNAGEGARISQVYDWKTPYQLLNDKAVFWEAIGVPVLVIDDLGREESTPQKKAAIAEIIGQRYDRKLTTAITTNLKPEEIQGRYGTPTFQRLIETGLFIESDGYSARVSKVEEAAS